jgi:plasmid stabilization system protein ParE
MAGEARVYATRNFAANLDSVEEFLSEHGQPTFRHLIQRLFEDICPILSQFPTAGRSFFAHREGSREAQLLIRRLKKKLQTGDDLREFSFDDYLLLYLVREKRIYLVALNHQRQLSFDLRRFWS